MNDLKHKRPGIHFKDGVATAIVWAPKATEVALLLVDNGDQIPMRAAGFGYWTTITGQLKHGDAYQWLIDKQALPDPASLAQPQGVHGTSQARDVSRFTWTDSGWKNPELDDYIIYELHTGTFTGAGTFSGIEERLDYLVDLGITAIEIMPVAAFPGERNWGYDGVFQYAVHTAYGGAEGLMKLVDQCHEKGLAVVLDVVYNHVGPEGNYLGQFGPYFTDKYKTPWGDAINFDDAGCDAVRSFFIQNALMWFRDFHIDALRLDAVHAIKDFSALHVLQELRQETDKLMRTTGRQHYLIVECDLNDTRFINPEDKGGYGMDSQWMDEFHHALRVAAEGDRSGYYADFNGIGHLAKSYGSAYVYDGIYSPHRDKTFGSKASSNDGKQFIVFSQNHDQVGNRMLGERTSTLVSFELQKLLAGAVLVSPFLPMFFMGEEYAEPAPFQYFVSHTDPALVQAVRDGRKAEFAAFHAVGEAPDPQAEETFLASKLNWQLIAQEPHKTLLHYYRALIRLRKENAALRLPDRSGVNVVVDESKQLLILYRKSQVQDIVCYLNFSNDVQHTNVLQDGTKLFDSASPEWHGPASSPGQITKNESLTIQPASLLIYQFHV